MKKSKIQKQAWQKMALVWKRYIIPPSRPCASQIKSWKGLIKKEIKNMGGAKALILGATPELRDMVLDMGFNVTVVDINPVMISAMTSLMKNKNLSKEKKVVKNWLEIDLPQHYFDLIVGDAAINQILTQKDVNRLIIKLRNLLNRKGIILIREVVRLNKRPIIEKDKDWMDWFNKYKSGKIDDCDLYSMFKYQSSVNDFKSSPALIDGAPLYYKLKPLYLRRKVPSSFYHFFIKVFGNPPVSKLLLIFLKNNLEKLLRKYFKLTILKFCSEHYHCQYMPQYLLKSKK